MNIDRSLLEKVVLFLLLGGLVVCGDAFGEVPLLAAGGNHSAVTKGDGSLWCWGENGFGQAGTGGIEPVTLPTLIEVGSQWVSIAKGVSHTVGIKNDGTLWAWGRNTEGELGDGTQVTRYLPTRIGEETDWARVAAGEEHTLALKTDGTLWAWGGNTFGQLGDGSAIGSLTPKRIGDPAYRWRMVAAGSVSSYAIRTDGTLDVWGSNAFGQLGDGTVVSQMTPQSLSSVWQYVSAGYAHVLALDSDGKLWVWGLNLQGQLGIGSSGNIAKSPLLLGSADDRWSKVAAGGFHSAAIKSDGTLWLWGADSYGQLGDGSSFLNDLSTTPVQLGFETSWVDVAAGDNHTLARKLDEELQGWGANSAGQLGGGVIGGESSSPAQVIADLTDVTPPSITLDTFLSPTRLVTQTIGGTVAVEVVSISVTALHDPAITDDDVTTVLEPPFTGDRWSCPTGALDEGGNQFVITALDGSANTTTLQRTIIRDSVAPEITGQFVLSTALPVASQSLRLTVDENLATVEVRTGMGTLPATLVGPFVWETSPQPITATLSPVTVNAVDLAGNAVDLSLPAPPALSGALRSSDTTPTWSWTSGGGGGGYLVSLDGVTESSTTATAYTPTVALVEGLHTVYLTEGDALGNWSPYVAATTEIDVTPPTVSVLSPLADEVTRLPLVVYTLSDGTAVVSVDGAETGYSSGATMALADGIHTLSVAAVDDLGNRAVSPVVTFTVDTVPPELTAPTDILTNLSSAFLIGTVEAGLTVTVTTATAASDGTASNDFLDDRIWFYRVTGLVLGDNPVTVEACDAAGNCTQVALVITLDQSFSLDPPETPINRTSLSLHGEVTPGLSVEADVAGNAGECGVAAGRWNCDLNGLLPGENTIRLQVWESGVVRRESETVVFVASLQKGTGAVSAGTLAVALDQPYKNPVVILGPVSAVDVTPVVARVGQVTSTSFNLHLDNWDESSPHGDETVSWLALEPGRYVMDDGAIWEVGTFAVAGNGTFAARSFVAAFPAPPAVYLTIQNRTAPLPVVAPRLRAVTTTGFEAALFSGEGAAPLPLSGSLGYLAVYQPAGAGTTAFGNGTWSYLLQGRALSSTPQRIYGSDYRLEEETTGDGETDHLAEDVTVLAFDQERFFALGSFVERDPVTVRSATVTNPTALDWGDVTLPPGQWLTIPFAAKATPPVVVAKSLSGRNGGYVQVRNVTLTSFELSFTSWAGASDPVNFFYLVTPAGSSSLAGLPVEAGQVDCLSLLSGSQPVAFAAPFGTTPPALFTSVQELGSDGPLQSRSSDLTAAGFSLFLQGPLSGQGGGSGCNGGTVGWIAIGTGVGATGDPVPQHVMAFHARAGDDATTLDFTRPFSEIIKPTIQGGYPQRYPGMEYSFGREVFSRYFNSGRPLLLADVSSIFDIDPVQLYLEGLTSRKAILRLREPADGAHTVEDLSLLLID